MATNGRAQARKGSEEENIFDVLAREHLIVVTLLDRIEAAGEAEDCEAARINSRWKAKFAVLKQLVEHHVDEEESKIFPAARKALTADEAIDLAGVFLEAKRDVMGYAADLEAPIDLEALTKEQLLERPRDAGMETTPA